MPTFNMGDQFKGLPMGDLIGGPLMAACEAQLKLANATANFIDVVGFDEDDKGNKAVRIAQFAFDRPRQLSSPAPPVVDEKGELQKITKHEVDTERVELDVPLLALVNIPSLSINEVDIIFDMEVKNTEKHVDSADAKAEMSAKAKLGWGPLSISASISGSVATHQENTRQTDHSAKYHVQVHAQDNQMPEGLARVLDILQSSIAPRSIGPTIAHNGKAEGSKSTPKGT